MSGRDPAWTGWAASAVVGAAVVALLLGFAVYVVVTERSEGEVGPSDPPPALDTDSFGC